MSLSSRNAMAAAALAFLDDKDTFVSLPTANCIINHRSSYPICKVVCFWFGCGVGTKRDLERSGVDTLHG